MRWMLLCGVVVSACGSKHEERAMASLTRGGSVTAGQDALHRYGCGGCHRIPGVPHANGKVGPSLEGVASRTYLAGHVVNEPNQLMAWIRFPKQLDLQTAMPDLGVGEREARDMAAYLYTLK